MTNFRKDLDLEVYSYVGGRMPFSSVLTPIVREASHATFLSFHVSGTVDNPQVGRASLAQLNMMPQMFPEKVAEANETQSPSRLIDRIRR